jgi:hypothetical protein
MAKKYSDAFYRSAVLGVEDDQGNRIPGLRNVARGFTAADGYDVRQPLTRARKRRIVEYWTELQQLTSQPKVLYRARVTGKLKKAQRAVGQDTRFEFKVAFVPFVGVAGAPPPKLLMKGDALIVKSSIGAQRFIPFVPGALATNSDLEIKRVVAEGVANMGEDAEFAIRAGKNMIKLFYKASKIQQQIETLMIRYDGARDLPRRSGNKKDDPSDHHWNQWLVGVEAYQFKKLSAVEGDAVLERFNRANTKNKKIKKSLQRKARG